MYRSKYSKIITNISVIMEKSADCFLKWGKFCKLGQFFQRMVWRENRMVRQALHGVKCEDELRRTSICVYALSVEKWWDDFIC